MTDQIPIVVDPDVPDGVALLVPRGAFGERPLLRLPLDLWPHDGPFWGGKVAEDRVIREKAIEAALDCEAHLARLLDDAWAWLGHAPAAWREPRAAETAKARWLAHTRTYMVEQRYAAMVVPPDSFVKVIATT